MSLDPGPAPLARAVPHTASLAAFPLGGIGTGNVSLGARGELRDWELENSPNKGQHNPFTFFAIHVRPVDQSPITRVLEAELNGPHARDTGYPFDQLAGLPRLRGATLRGAYPWAHIDFDDDVLPVTVSLDAFTPLVPLDSAESGIPGAILRYTVHNPGSGPVKVTIVGSVSHVAGRGDGAYGISARQTVKWRDDGRIRGLDFGVELPPQDPRSGTLALTTSDMSVTKKPQWVTSFWPDGSRLLWNDLTDDGLLDEESRETSDEASGGSIYADRSDDRDLLDRLPRLRTGSLGIVHNLDPGEDRVFEFVLTWGFPYRHRGWGSDEFMIDPADAPVMLNRYAARWPDAWSAAIHLHANLATLEGSTRDFADALYGGSLNPILAEAVGAAITTARSTTCMVIDDGSEAGQFAAWEGSCDHHGSCAGTCTHVWNYAQTIAWLWPDLERSARRNEYLLETDAHGAQEFRTNRIFGGPSWGVGPAVDGQLGTFIRLHREWRFSGDDAFLAELWPAATRTLDYAIEQWDTDGDGLLDGALHNTFDIEFHGPEPLANSLFIAALRAGAAMATHRGELDRATRWSDAAGRASQRMDDVLFNGEFYHQVVDDVDKARYQYGEGVLSDQLLGQFHAHLNGLGYVLDPDHVRSAVGAIVEHNFRADLTGHENLQRAFAVAGEGGLLLASWPRGGRPRIPFVYSDEVWTGVEYEVATLLLYEGMSDDATRLVGALRARYDGTVRNPWNEIECGNHYARSLSSWGLLVAASGADYDAPTRRLGFSPVAGLPFRSLFTCATGWGVVEVTAEAMTVSVHGGHVDIDRLELAGELVAGPLRIEAGRSSTSPLPIARS